MGQRDDRHTDALINMSKDTRHTGGLVGRGRDEAVGFGLYRLILFLLF